MENDGLVNVDMVSEHFNHADIKELSNGMLETLHMDIKCGSKISISIEQIKDLGAGVKDLGALIKKLEQTKPANTQGLYRLANESVGDVLKNAKSGNFWGAFRTAEGKSKLAKLAPVTSASAVTETAMIINPATVMMAVSIFVMDQQVGKIIEMQKQITSFLEMEKESEIEADIELLINLFEKYKHNWDNEHFISSNHKLVLDVQRTARKNMRSYQKQVIGMLQSSKLIVAKSNVIDTLNELKKKLLYYRLSLFIFAMSSWIEVMLSGNFKEENILIIRNEIEMRSLEYRDIFTKCSIFLEKFSNSALETNVLKGVGKASEVIGKIVGNIPVVKEGLADEFLQENGKQIQENIIEKHRKIIESFAEINNPNTGVFIEKMNAMIRIYNHTSEICFDDKNIYLIAG